MSHEPLAVAASGQPSHIAHIAEQLDALMTLELRPRGRQGTIPHLYRAAREQLGKPLTLACAELLAAIRPGSTVILTTGAGHPDFLPRGETDGPPGVVAIAAVLSLGMRIVPVLVTEAEFVDSLAVTAVAGGVGVRDYASARRTPFTCAVVPFPADASADQVAIDYLAGFAPAALVACEKIGPNRQGVAHYASGIATAEPRARVEMLFDRASAAGIPSVGIGDNGNEIGCGLIFDAVQAHKEYGRTCQCPCGDGLATRVATDALAVGSTSNWAAYGVAACLAAMIGRPDLIRDVESERRTLEQCYLSGANDGVTGRAVDWVDGTPADVSIAIQTLMRRTVEACSAEPYQRPF